MEHATATMMALRAWQRCTGRSSSTARSYAYNYYRCCYFCCPYAATGVVQRSFGTDKSAAMLRSAKPQLSLALARAGVRYAPAYQPEDPAQPDGGVVCTLALPGGTFVRAAGTTRKAAEAEAVEAALRAMDVALPRTMQYQATHPAPGLAAASRQRIASSDKHANIPGADPKQLNTLGDNRDWEPDFVSPWQHMQSALERIAASTMQHPSEQVVMVQPRLLRMLLSASDNRANSSKGDSGELGVMASDLLAATGVREHPSVSLAELARRPQPLPAVVAVEFLRSAASSIEAQAASEATNAQARRRYFEQVAGGILIKFVDDLAKRREQLESVSLEALLRRRGTVLATCTEAAREDELVCIAKRGSGALASGALVALQPLARDAFDDPYVPEGMPNLVLAIVVSTTPLVLRLAGAERAVGIPWLVEAMRSQHNRGGDYQRQSRAAFRIDTLQLMNLVRRTITAAAAIAGVYQPDTMALPSGTISNAIIATPLPTADTIKSRGYAGPNPGAEPALDEEEHGFEASHGVFASFGAGAGAGAAAAAAAAVVVEPPAAPQPTSNPTLNQYTDACQLPLSPAEPPPAEALLSALNPSQRLAVTHACARPLTLVQGAPGTGKTTVAAAILEHWAGQDRQSLPGKLGAGVVGCTQSNRSADRLLMSLLDRGVRAVRLGRAADLPADLQRYCVDMHVGMANRQQHQAYREHMLNRADVIVCTVISIASAVLDAFAVTRVAVDDSTQSTEAGVLPAFCRGAQQVVLLGDYCQHPPTVTCWEAQVHGHGLPLFTRLVRHGHTPLLLDTQYRMHPALAEFPSHLFYGGQLQHGAVAKAATEAPPPGFPWPQPDLPVAFVDVDLGSEQEHGHSYINHHEVDVVVNVVAGLVAAGAALDSIGVLVPYVSQKRLLDEALQAKVGGVTVETITGFAGLEKEIIVLSTVRCNQTQHLGTVADWRRLNVALTRAHSALIVVGSGRTLVNDVRAWRWWLMWVLAQEAALCCHHSGAWVPLDERSQAWSRQLREELNTLHTGDGVLGGTAEVRTSKAQALKALRGELAWLSSSTTRAEQMYPHHDVER